MKTKLILSLTLVILGAVSTACDREENSCVENYMEDDMSQSLAEEKCDEELVETVVILDELK